MSMGLSLGLSLSGQRVGGGGSTVLTVGALPTSLPASPDATATDVANLKSLVSGAPSGNYYIAVPDGADWDVGSTNYNNGSTTTDLTWILPTKATSTIYIAPASFYAQNFSYTSNPMGDGNNYTRRLALPCTLRGFIQYSSAVHLWGFKRTIDLFPTAPNAWPGSYQTWENIGVQNSGTRPNYLDYASGAFNGSFRWNEYYIGKDASHTPFDITEKLLDFNSPDYWNAFGNRLSRVGMITASVTSGTDVLNVTVHAGKPIAVGDAVVKRGTISELAGSVTILAQLTGTPGGVGTYQMSVTASGNNTYTSTVGDSGNSIFISEVTGTRIYTGWGDATYAAYNRAYFMPSAVYVAGWTGTTVTVSDNYIHDMFDGIRVTANASTRRHMIICDNQIERMYHDYLRYNWDSNGRVRVTALRNIELDPLPGVSDSFDSHGDASQAYGNTAPSSETGQYGWNIGLTLASVDLTCRGIFQHQFFQMLYTNVLVGLKSFDNLVASANKGFFANSQRQSWFKNSVYVSPEASRPNSSNFPRVTLGINAKPFGNNTIVGPIKIENMIAEGLSSTSQAAPIITAGDNTTDLPIYSAVGRSALTSPLFADLNRATPTVNDHFLALAEKGVSAGTRGTQYATLAEMMSADMEHEIWTAFQDQAGLTTSSTVTSARAYVHGIEGTSINVVPASGVSWGTYGPSNGAVLRAIATGSGTMLAGQDLVIQDTTSASALTQKLSTVALDGVDYSFRSITAPATFYTTADNQTTAYSRIAKPSDARTFKGFVVALIGVKFDAFTNGAIVMADKGTNGYAKIGLSTLGSGRLSTQWLGNTSTEGGTIVNFDIGTDTTNRHTYIFAGDFTQTSNDTVVKCVKDYALCTHGGTEVFNTNGTKTFTIGDFFGASGIGLFDVYAGTSTNMDGSIQALWIELYEDPLDIPDITDVDVINAFTKDMLSVNGDGSVTGVLTQPMVFIQGPVGATDGSTANSWNATGGITNLGYGGGSMTKQTGTYA